MSKTLWYAPIVLNPGVKGEDVEKFFVDEYLPNVSELPGYKVTLSKCTDGKRAGQYLFSGHFESPEREKSLFPVYGDISQASEEWNQWVADNPVFQKLMSFIDFDGLMAEDSLYIEID